MNITLQQQELNLLNNFKNDLGLIKSYTDFESYFDSCFVTSGLKKWQFKLFKKLAEDNYNFAKNNILITSVKYSDFKLLISAGSVSYMGKYGTWNKIKVNI